MFSDASGQSCVAAEKNRVILVVAQKSAKLRKLCPNAWYVYAARKERKIQGSLATFSNSFSQVVMWLSASQRHTLNIHGCQGSGFPPLPSHWIDYFVIRQNKTQRHIQKISTLYSAEAPNNLGTHEYPGLPNIPVILHEAIWLLPPFPFQNTVIFARTSA